MHTATTVAVLAAAVGAALTRTVLVANHCRFSCGTPDLRDDPSAGDPAANGAGSADDLLVTA